MVPEYRRQLPPRLSRKQRDEPRGNRHSRGYTAAWAKLSADFLRKNPLCAECERQKRDTLADLVDHIRPVRDFPALVLQKSNLQAICRPCHGRKTAMEEYARKRGLLDELPAWVEDLNKRPVRFKPFVPK